MLVRSLLPFLLLVSALRATEYPIATIITAPGAEYDDTKRSWQGIPGIERAANGRLWTTWYTGDVGEGAIGNYAMAATCANVGQKWSKPMAIQGPQGTRIGDPLPWIDPKGRLWIFYAQFSEKTDVLPLRRATFAIRTDDPGNATPKWSEPFVVAPDGILFGKPIIRHDGAWVAPFFVNGQFVQSPEVAGKQTGVLVSKDEGASWQWLGGTDVPEALLNFSEVTIAQRKDNSLFMVIRTSVGLYESTSADGGHTWSEAKPMRGFEKGPSTRACMRKLASGAYMLVYHDGPPNKNGGYGRARLTVWLSDDEGHTWPHKLLLDERSGVSYPDALQAPDGRLFITYDLGRYRAGDKAVLVSVLREEDIRAGKIVSKDAKLNLVANQCYAYGNHSDLREEVLS